MSTSIKCGTTWTQMICALLVHRSATLPTSLTELSLWLDHRLETIDNVVSAYDSQPYRRLIKTHTPLDGLPFREDVDYVVCGRDPRDAFMSALSANENVNVARVVETFSARGETMVPPPQPPTDINEGFKVWLTTPCFAWERDGAPFSSLFHHAETFWEHRSLPNIHFVHYADLMADLEGQMRRLAKALRTEIPESAWPQLVHAATFEEMKANADTTAPASHLGMWSDNRRFFNKGTIEQWRGVLSDESLALYLALTRERYDPSMLEWLERGAMRVGYPEQI